MSRGSSIGWIPVQQKVAFLSDSMYLKKQVKEIKQDWSGDGGDNGPEVAHQEGF